VSTQRAVELLRDRFGCARLTDEHDGIAAVRQAAEILLLFLCELHEKRQSRFQSDERRWEQQGAAVAIDA